jgi:solute carrier family 13 (sodium-dependent dicarboxylate transporter), member 2/3/5
MAMGTHSDLYQEPAMKVLCVESERDRLDALRRMLEAGGYDVLQARDGKQALEVLRHQQVDGVLLEYDLPDGTGTALRPKLKQLSPNIPILLFAGLGVQTPFLLKFFDQYLRSKARTS